MQPPNLVCFVGSVPALYCNPLYTYKHDIFDQPEILSASVLDYLTYSQKLAHYEKTCSLNVRVRDEQLWSGQLPLTILLHPVIHKCSYLLIISLVISYKVFLIAFHSPQLACITEYGIVQKRT